MPSALLNFYEWFFRGLGVSLRWCAGLVVLRVFVVAVGAVVVAAGGGRRI